MLQAPPRQATDSGIAVTDKPVSTQISLRLWQCYAAKVSYRHSSGKSRLVQGWQSRVRARLALTERSVVRIACERRKTLVLADLTGAALKALGLNNDISASADYTTSQAWARAIHGASPRWDGIRYVSRQMNKGFAYAIFERSGLRKVRAEKLKARQLDDLCDRFNVTVV